jgi:hypothetical protein
MTTLENSRSRPDSADSRFFPTCLVKKWHVADPKMIFAKNQEVYFLALMCKTTPVPTKSAGTCTKFKKYIRRLPQQNESWYAYPRWSTIYGGCFPELSISRFGSCFIKNPISVLRKWKKHFSWYKTKIGLPVDSSWEFPVLRPTFLRVLPHVSEEGDTSEIDIASLSTLTHVATYIRGKW